MANDGTMVNNEFFRKISYSRLRIICDDYSQLAIIDFVSSITTFLIIRTRASITKLFELPPCYTFFDFIMKALSYSDMQLIAVHHLLRNEIILNNEHLMNHLAQNNDYFEIFNRLRCQNSMNLDGSKSDADSLNSAGDVSSGTSTYFNNFGTFRT
ncbi:hypothetical protein KIN20_016074 [Parelaphostrongylus tenuis]|uniref:Uncharacterized protein n=1 Tax=Parelaphostrongylus tenuis TaxID=148309 RepID=A0AAD5MFW3_PARTN|nr:hypothetical protein KIN20_016074 [Parelaphostrongylus tenuis]